MSYTRVLSHEPIVRQVLASQPEYAWIETDVLLALMVVESGGDLDARRSATMKRSVTWTDAKGKKKRTTFRIKSKAQYSGPYQHGHAAGLDVGMEAKRRTVRVTLPNGQKALLRVGWDTTDHLRGDLVAATKGICDYMVRYQARHNWDPRAMAMLWKAGPGTLSTINRVVEERQLPLMKAVLYAQKHHGIPRANVYLKRFDKAYARITKVRGERQWRQTVASVQSAGEAVAESVTAPVARWRRLLRGVLS